MRLSRFLPARVCFGGSFFLVVILLSAHRTHGSNLGDDSLAKILPPAAPCQSYLSFLHRYRFVEEAFDRAGRAAPADPLRRAMLLRQYLIESGKSADAENVVAYDGHEVLFKKNRYTQLSVEPVASLNTLRYRAKAGRMTQDTQVLMPMLHGWTAVTSQSGAMLAAINLMTTAKKNDLKNEIKAQGNWVNVAAEACDAPLHGAGPTRYDGLDALLEWHYRWFSELKQQGREQGLPLVPLSRSSGSLMLMELNRRHPGLFDGMILMSPVHPQIGFEEGLDGLEHDVQNTALELNPLSFQMYVDVGRELRQQKTRWWESAAPLGLPPTPTLLLVGGDDVQTPPSVRSAYRDLVQRGGPGSQYLFVPQAGHDVIAMGRTPDERQRAAKVWGQIYYFLNHSILKNEKAPPLNHDGFIYVEGK